MSSGFSLRELRLSGFGVDDAVLGFRDGLNVIAGPSETGKTYVAQCLTFMLGGSAPPRRVPESEPYSHARLTLLARRDGTTHQLRRTLVAGSPIEHTTGNQPVRELKAKTKGGDLDTVSAFLLDLAGLDGLVVRTNAGGATRSLSFRDVARLFFIDESTVIHERSPVLSGQNTKKTEERRVFRALLTGRDDHDVVAVEKADLARSRRTGRTEALQELLDSARLQLQQADVSGTVEEAEHRAAQFAGAADAAAAELQLIQEAALPIEERRREALAQLRRVRSLVRHRQELQLRFELLREQYQSDLDRLALTAETTQRLEQLVLTNCPVCGAPAQYQDHEHAADQLTEEVAAACRAEAAKVTVLQSDLEATINNNQDVIGTLLGEADGHQGAVAEADLEVQALIQPRLSEATSRLQESERQRSGQLQAAARLRQVAELHELIAEARATVIEQRAEGSTGGADAAEVDQFLRRVEALLQSWNMPMGDRVTWSETDEDLVLDGRPRASFGKGTRAVIRAAFHLGLLRTLLDQDRPSPGMAVIDSPLVVYRQPDAPGEEVPLEVKSHFYESVAERFQDAQVVIFENDDPPNSLVQTATVTYFTKSERQGRAGFFPIGHAG